MTFSTKAENLSAGWRPYDQIPLPGTFVRVIARAVGCRARAGIFKRLLAQLRRLLPESYQESESGRRRRLYYPQQWQCDFGERLVRPCLRLRSSVEG